MLLQRTRPVITPTSLYIAEVILHGHLTNPAPYRARYDEEIRIRFRHVVSQLEKSRSAFDEHICENLDLYIRTVKRAWKEFVLRGIRTPDDVSTFERGAQAILSDCWNRQKKWNAEIEKARLSGRNSSSTGS